MKYQMPTIIFLDEDGIQNYIEACKRTDAQLTPPSQIDTMLFFIKNCLNCYWTGTSWSQSPSNARPYLWKDLPQTIPSQVTGQPIYFKYDLPIGTAAWYENHPLDHDSWVGPYDHLIKPSQDRSPDQDSQPKRRIGP